MLLSVIAVYEESDVADAGTDAMQGHHCRTPELLCWSHRCNDAGCYAEEHAEASIMKSQQMTVLLKKMIQVSQWRKRHRCYGRRLCKKADTRDDGDANVADNVIDVAHADADVAEVTEADVVDHALRCWIVPPSSAVMLYFCIAREEVSALL